MSDDRRTDDDGPMDEDAMLAAEYALGLLGGAELAEAERRAQAEPAFAAQVTGWEADFAALAEALPPEVPPARAKAALMARVFGANPAPRLWQRLWLWQALSAACIALAALAFVFTLAGPQDSPGPLYTAEIASESGDFRVVAVVDKSANEVLLTRTAGAAPEGRILQVWAHGPDAPAVSVGLWPEGDSVRLPMPPVIAAVEGVLTLGVSEEPPGGSLTGAPSGRVFGTVDIPGVTAGL